MKTTTRAGIVSLLLIAAVGWYVVAFDYGDSVAVGSYRLRQGGESSSLILRADYTFQQTVTHDGKITRRCEGTWRRIGAGGIAFSKEFIPVSGQEPGADGTSYGEIHKTLGLFPSIALAQYHVLWYGKIDQSSKALIAGTYAGDEEGVPATLVMKGDHTFDQQITHAGIIRQAHGTWGARENGDILFSKEFLKISGEPLNTYEVASARDPKGSNLQIQVAVNSSFAQPIFRKKILGY